MKNIGAQLCLGAWASMAISFGILSRSWETFFGLMATTAFFTLGVVASKALRSKLPAIRWGGIVGTIAFYGVILFGFLGAAERLYLVNGKSYPSWLAKEDLGQTNELDGLLFVGSKSGIKERAKLDMTAGCAGKNSELYHKGGGLVVIRCGGMMWYDSHTYVAHVEGKQ